MLTKFAMPIITLTTDFGTRDGYVGAMKGVIARRAREARIVDISHDVPRGDIAHAAWVIRSVVEEFPDETIHVVVVDPGVGGERRELVVKQRWTLVGPDNGVFTYVARPSKGHEPDRAWAIERAPFRADPVSPTFHGRDVFAVAAAALASGHSAAEAGTPAPITGLLPWGLRPRGTGRIVHIDHYGNLISDMPAREAGEMVMIAGRSVPIVRTYSAVAQGMLLAYIGSMNTVEFAVRDGRADRVLDVPRGTPVVPSVVHGPTGPYR